MKQSVILLLPALLLISCNDGAEPDRYHHPNIIILYADDMGYGDLAIQNPESKIPTPNLDQLAREGLRFTDGHSSSGICTPSRYALLTGRYHWRDFHNIVGPMGEPVFTKNQFTLPVMLKEAGYNTACIGKWHLGWDWEAIRKKDFAEMEIFERNGHEMKVWPAQAYDWTLPIPGGPLERGFDYYFGDGVINFPPYTWIENDRVLEVPTTTMFAPDGMALEGNWEARPGPALKDWDFYNVLPTLTQKAVQFIRDQEGKEKPFFLYMSLPSPHAPIIPNEEFRGESEAGPYGDFVFQTDWCVGEILRTLDEIGQSENSIIIFTSDNGPERYAYDRIINFGHHSAAPFRGLKRDLYEGGHHVPFLVRWPGYIKKGSVSEDVFSQVDLMKTIAEILELELPEGLVHDSHDFSGHWLGDPGAENIRKATIQNTFEGRYAIRMGSWLYINHENGYHTNAPEWVYDYFGYEPLSDTVQLYNLADDPFQKNNLSEQFPDRVKEMQSLLMKIRETETFTE